MGMKLCLMLNDKSINTMINKSWEMMEREETVKGFKKLSRSIHGLENLL